MRPIDADKLFPYGSIPFVENDGFATADKIYGIIKNAPTIDPESLRPQSEWEHFTRRENGQDVCYVRCKRCRKERGFDYGLNYCPNCGAKMKGVK